jgi:hypothetical protein
VGKLAVPETDKRWLNPWQWVVGLLPPLWLAWSGVELVRGLRGKAPVVSHRQGRRMHLLPLAAQVTTIAVFWPWLHMGSAHILFKIVLWLVLTLPKSTPKKLPPGPRS